MNHFLAAARASRFGPALLPNGEAVFRLYAPSCEHVELSVDGTVVDMQTLPSGWFEARLKALPGACYGFILPDGKVVPDPAARAQCVEDASKSVLVDPSSYAWKAKNWKGRPWHEMVIYELHVGLFGGFKTVTSRLLELASFGITAVELMPVADFEGHRSWGYDGTLPFAPTTAYGTPDELKALIDTAHSLNMCVFLDVVYNHFGPVGNFLPTYAKPFFRDDVDTPWGSAIDFRQTEVREFYFENAFYWLEEFRFDGLRFDAVHAIEDAGWLSELPRQLRTALPDRHIHLILENDHNDAPLLGHGYNAQWNDDLHHTLHVLLTGETEGYYQDYAQHPARKLARALGEGFVYQGEPSAHHDGRPRGTPSGHLPAYSFVAFLQNHDQIGNRAFGERLATLTTPEQLDAALTLLLLAPHIPMLFMGEEVNALAPFHYFADFEGDLADAIREGRKLEFGSFSNFADSKDSLPDPIAQQTFDESIVEVLPRNARNPETVRHTDLVRSLLVLRSQLIIPRLEGCQTVRAEAVGERAVFAEWLLNDGNHLCMFANLGKNDASLAATVTPETATMFESRDGVFSELRAGNLPAATTVVWIQSGDEASLIPVEPAEESILQT